MDLDLVALTFEKFELVLIDALDALPTADLDEVLVACLSTELSIAYNLDAICAADAASALAAVVRAKLGLRVAIIIIALDVHVQLDAVEHSCEVLVSRLRT